MVIIISCLFLCTVMIMKMSKRKPVHGYGYFALPDTDIRVWMSTGEFISRVTFVLETISMREHIISSIADTSEETWEKTSGELYIAEQDNRFVQVYDELPNLDDFQIGDLIMSRNKHGFLALWLKVPYPYKDRILSAWVEKEPEVLSFTVTNTTFDHSRYDGEISVLSDPIDPYNGTLVIWRNGIGKRIFGNEPLSGVTPEHYRQEMTRNQLIGNLGYL